MSTLRNLFAEIPDSSPQELFATLIENPDVRIERIVSHGQVSDPDFWYDQDQHEWVLVLKGSAKLRFAEGDQIVELGPGDFVEIPAHQKHRVEWTASDEPTVWLAVYYGKPS